MQSNLFWLNDRQWARIEPHLPTNLTGPERKDDRRIISGIVHMLQRIPGTRQKLIPAAVESVPTSFGSEPACGGPSLVRGATLVRCMSRNSRHRREHKCWGPTFGRQTSAPPGIRTLYFRRAMFYFCSTHFARSPTSRCDLKSVSETIAVAAESAMRAYPCVLQRVSALGKGAHLRSGAGGHSIP